VELVSYAQFLEDIRLYRVLKDIKNGFYIDVGANHPLDHSVTKLFYEKGWSGINIEPSPRWFDELVKDRPRDVNLKLAASAAAGEAIFHDIGETGLSTLIDEFADRAAAAGYPGSTIRVETRRLADICDEHVRGEIHFLKIDVEGAEKAVIDGCDFAKHRPWIILIEATEPMTTVANHFAWEPTLTSHAYLLAGADRVNRYYLAQEHAELLPILSLPADQYRLREDQLQRDALNQQKAELIIELDKHKIELDKQKIELDKQKIELDKHKERIDSLLEELATLRQHLDTMTQSRFWRMTAPLRAAADAYKKFRQGSA
jgi:FkbM family methyltransferase